MSVFRKRPDGFTPPPSEAQIIHSLESVTEVVSGTPVVKEVIVPMSVEQYHEKHPISKEDFTLAQELRAGVSVKDVPTNGLLDSVDNLDYEVNETAEETLLNALESEENK